MLYLKNTNQLQSLGGGVERGGAIALISSSVSASYTTNSSSLFVLLNDATTKLSTTASATTNFLAAPNSVVSASLSATTPSSSVSMSLFISASDGSLLFTGSSTGSGIMTSFVVGNNLKYTISSSFNRQIPLVTGSGLFRTSFNGYFADDPSFFETATTISGGVNLSPIALGTATGSGNNFSVQWLGYFKPTTTNLYSIYLQSDDAAYLWLGGSATASLVTTSSALIGNPGTHSAIENTASIDLVANTLYPMRIQYGENTGGEVFSVSVSTDAIPKTTNLTASLFYNTNTNGF